ncbi:hypothetical protein L484_015722 [Morus notabilis]|uniref:endo-polygalacturonase n=1 Tax=Morus notabilis TaxID=981085 RepID=W9SPN3_9ROSA|nr:hypothetical protein L484_015722 [Morus notabilis]
MHSRSSLIIISFLIILVLFSFGSCSGRSLDDQPRLGHHDHGDFMDYLINSMARIFRLERYLKQEDHDEGKTILNVDDFAAKRNGKLDDTKAFKKAWEKARSSKGTTILGVLQLNYLVKSINFDGLCKSNNLAIQIQGTIKASDKRSEYNEYCGHCLLFYNSTIQHLSVQGCGILHGINGDIWWKHSSKINKFLGGSESAHNIKIFVNIQMNNVRDPIIIDQIYCDQKNTKFVYNKLHNYVSTTINLLNKEVKKKMSICLINGSYNQKSSTFRVKDILYQNITGITATKVAIKLVCSKTFRCPSVNKMKDVDIRQHHHTNDTDTGVVSLLRPNAYKGRNKTKPSFHRSHHKKIRNPSEPSIQQPAFFNVDEFGAKGNVEDDTEAFKKAWEKACSSKAPAFVVVPPKNYLVRPIKFKGPCKSNLTIQIHGTVEASDDRSDYNDLGRHWLLFDGVDNLVLEGCGSGTLNGNGETWWKHSCKLNKSLALTLRKCQKLAVRDLKIKDAQQIQVSLEHSKHVKVSNLTITAPRDSPNTDGIHVTDTQDIVISKCVIETGDDCISIASGSQKVRATDITCGPGHGISIGSLGSENSEAHVSDVIVRKAKLFRTMNGVRIKTWQGGSGCASNIKFIDFEMHNVQNPIIIDQNYCDKKKPCKEQISAVQVKDVLYQNIKGTSTSDVAIKFDCSKSFGCEGIVLRDVDLRRKQGDHVAEAFCNNVEFTDIGDVSPLCPR